MNPALTLIAASIAAALGFTSAWQIQAHTITKIHLEQADERIAIQRANRTQAERHIETVKVAQEQAQDSLRAAAADRARATDALGRLQQQSEDSLRAGSQSLDACVVDATAKTELFAHCSRRLVEVSAAADGHVIDLEALTAAWPKE